MLSCRRESNMSKELENFMFEFFNWEEFKKYLDSLSDKDAAQLVSLIEKIQDHGIRVAKKMKWVKKLISTDDLYEIRSSAHGNQQRVIYFKLENEKYIITHGFVKKTQKTPLKEIRKSENRKRIYLKNHKRN